jgi:two-component system, NarL family, nitrate/nitrite response regulator NarL
LTLHTQPTRSQGLLRAVRVAIVDDHEVFRMGLRSLLERAPRLEIAWDAASAHDAFERLQQEPVDAVLIDINLGGPIDGIEATERMVGAWPGLKVILISGLTDERRLSAARRAGAAGFLPKELEADEMVQAIVQMVSGTMPGAAGSLHPGGRETGPVSAAHPLQAFESLSPREMEVLGEVRWARTNREIADRLGVSTTTVNKHVHQILRKLGLRNRAEAAILAGKLLSQPRHGL